MSKPYRIWIYSLTVLETRRLRPHSPSSTINKFLSVAFRGKILNSDVRNWEGATVIHGKHARRGRTKGMLLIILTIIDICEICPVQLPLLSYISHCGILFFGSSSCPSSGSIVAYSHKLIIANFSPSVAAFSHANVQDYLWNEDYDNHTHNYL